MKTRTKRKIAGKRWYLHLREWYCRLMVRHYDDVLWHCKMDLTFIYVAHRNQWQNKADWYQKKLKMKRS